MTKMETVFRSIIGKNPLYMRPPAGVLSTEALTVLGELNYKVILWDIDSNDWRYAQTAGISNEQQNYKNVIENDSKTNPQGHIALHHDVYKKTVDQLVPWVVQYIKGKKNYKFVSVAECLGNTKGSAYKTKQ